MTILPNAKKAIIITDKLLDYILSSEHPEGKYKAVYFKKFGYQATNSRTFEKDIRGLIQSHDTSDVVISDFGTKYIVEGPLLSPSGKSIEVCTVWVILNGEDTPRLATAYPGGRK